MKKSDLKSGRVVEVRNGDLYLVVGDFITREFDYELLSKYDENLIHDINSDYDIVKVYEHKNDLYDNNATTLEALFDRECLTLLCERKEREEHNLTKREVEILKALQTLGYEWLKRDVNGRLEVLTADGVLATRIYEDLFAFINWEDGVPTKIKELLK